MSNPVEFRSARDVASNKTQLMASFDDMIMHHALPQQVLELIAKGIADCYVQEHYQEIAALLDQNAIANLAVADAGKKIAEEIRSKPTVLHDRETRTQVYQGGIFGGLRKL
jgi:hypothetical protein